MSWQIIESGSLSPDEIMAKDAQLLNEIESINSPILHFYDWNVPCLTYGYFTKPEMHIDLASMHNLGLYAAKRPTGGGIIFHLTDLAFSVILPSFYPGLSTNSLENYYLINSKVAQAISLFLSESKEPILNICQKDVTECFSFCMAKPTQYDVVIDGKKAAGAAQRKTKKGLLHQGSISLCLPPKDLLAQILKENILQAMAKNSYCLSPDAENLQADRSRLKTLLVHEFFL